MGFALTLVKIVMNVPKIVVLVRLILLTVLLRQKKRNAETDFSLFQGLSFTGLAVVNLDVFIPNNNDYQTVTPLGEVLANPIDYGFSHHGYIYTGVSWVFDSAVNGLIAAGSSVSVSLNLTSLEFFLSDEFTLMYYQISTNTWIEATSTCAIPTPQTITDPILTATICYTGQYALFFGPANSSSLATPVTTTITLAISDIFPVISSLNVSTGSLANNLSQVLITTSLTLFNTMGALTLPNSPEISLQTNNLAVQVSLVDVPNSNSLKLSIPNPDTQNTISVKFPDTFSSALPSDALEAQISLLSSNLNPYAWSPTSSSLIGGVIEISAADPMTLNLYAINISDSQPGITITFPPVNVNITTVTVSNTTYITNSSRTVVCKFWDSTMVVPNCNSSETCIGGWSTVGVKTIIESTGSILCVSQHLTTFSIHLDFVIDSVPVPTLQQVVLIFALMGGVIFISIILLLVAYYLDRKATEPHSIHVTYGGTFYIRFKERYFQNIKEKHLYTSLISDINHIRRFTRVQRVLSLIASVLLSLGINSLFEEAHGANINDNALIVQVSGHSINFPLVGFYTSVLVFPVTLLILFSFNYAAGHEQQIVKIIKTGQKLKTNLSGEKPEVVVEMEKTDKISTTPLKGASDDKDQKNKDDTNGHMPDEKQMLRRDSGAELSVSDQRKLSRFLEKPVDDSLKPSLAVTVPKKHILNRQELLVPSSQLISDENIEIRIVPSYHDLDFQKTRNIFLSREFWLTIAYFFCFASIVVGIILPFFYAGNMSHSNQIYWIIDAVISLAVSAFLWLPFVMAITATFNALKSTPPSATQNMIYF